MNCTVDGCNGRVLARGMCRKHYLRRDRERHPDKWREYRRTHYARNRERLLAEKQRAYEADPASHIEKARRSHVKHKYGLTLEEYEAILARGCAICGAHGPRMALDHDHANGKIRDALCTNCNNGLGRFKDDPDRLRMAASYLEKHHH